MNKTKISGLIVLCLVLLTSSIGFANQLSILPGRFMPGDALVSPVYNSQLAPEIAQGGDKLLVVWEDSRSIVGGGTESETGRDIYALRLDSAGNLLDATPIAVSSAAASQSSPKVAWNGSNWLVVFEGNGPNGTGYYDKGLYAVRVSPGGLVLDPQPIALHGTKPSGGSYWALASDGNNWVVAVQGTSTSGDIVGIRISPTGVVLDPPTRTLVDSTYYMRSNIKLAYAGGVFLLTYNDQYLSATYETRGLRFDSNLNLLGAPVQLLTVPASDLAGQGSQFYLAWSQQQPDFSTAVYGTRLDSSAQMLDGSGDNLSGDSFSLQYQEIAATWDGLNWRISWSQSGELRLARVNSAGSVLDPGGVAVSGPSAGGTAGAGNGALQMVWAPYMNSDQGIVTASINASNQAGPNRDISLGAPRQVRPDLASNGNGYLVAYLSSTGSGHRVLVQALDATGNPLTGEPVELASGDLSSGPGAPAVAWNGSVYLVAWGNGAGIQAQRLNPNGSKLDPAPFQVIAAAYGPPDLEAVGDTFLVLGRKCGYSCQFIDLYAARVSGASGSVIDSTPLYLAGGYIGRPAAISALNGRWLVVYHSNWSHDESNADTGALFVNPDGTTNAIGGLYNFSTAGGNGFFRIGLASNGTAAMMVQSAEISSGVETDLLYRLIYPDGTLSPVVNLTPWRGNQYNPQVTWDGTNFVIVYEEQKNRQADLDMLDGRSDLFGMRVSPTGVVLDTQGFVFSTNPAGETLPAAASQNGTTLIAGSILRPEAPFANYRIGYSLFGSATNQPPVAVAAASPAGGSIPLAVNFNSAGSLDPGGSISAYAWDFGDGSISNLANPSHTFTTPGPFLVHLTVTDNAGSQTSQAILVQALAPNQAPIAVAQAVPAAGPAPLDVTFYADQSYDPDGSIGNIKWTFHDGSYTWGSTGYYTYPSPGVYQATLTVYDGQNATGVDSVTINVGGSASPTPTVTSIATPTRTPAPNPSPTPTRRFFRTPTPTAKPPTLTPTTSPSTATPTLTATLPIGPSSTPTLTPTVAQACTLNCLRSTNIALSTKGVLSVTVTGKVTVKNENGSLVASASVTVSWARPDGSKVTQTALTDATGVATFTTNGGRGTYTLTVTNISKTGSLFDPFNSLLSKSITR
ncbi:MAG: PKD domain-containing protein [Anaerolineales bacterium]|nr:PKD domain-containing protein [Anaerolineales bacterium]